MEFPNIVETKSKGEKMYLISAYFDEHNKAITAVY